jgi:hypothetical protein
MLFRKLIPVVFILLAFAAWSAPAHAASAGDAIVAKKKCKGKKKWSKKAKKCVKKKKAAPKASGPQIPLGDYVCSYVTSYGSNYAGTVHILAGNRYAVNEGALGAYKYFPDTGIMQFPSGDYSTMFARYSADSNGFDVFSAVNDGILEYGDYSWTCNAS